MIARSVARTPTAIIANTKKTYEGPVWPSVRYAIPIAKSRSSSVVAVGSQRLAIWDSKKKIGPDTVGQMTKQSRQHVRGQVKQAAGRGRIDIQREHRQQGQDDTGACDVEVEIAERVHFHRIDPDTSLAKSKPSPAFRIGAVCG